MIDVAVVGATGVVGDTLLTLFEERDFPIGQCVCLASEESVGKSVECQGKTLAVEALQGFDFSTVDVAFFMAGQAVSEQWVPEAVEAGCLVIDNSSRFRLCEDVPLVVPEVNGELLDHCPESCIIVIRIAQPYSCVSLWLLGGTGRGEP